MRTCYLSLMLYTVRSVLLILILCCWNIASGVTGEDIIRKMYKRYNGKWHPTLSFTQTTEFYSNDSLTGTQTWYEVIKYPVLFRMDFGDTTSGNFAIYRSDSVYRYKDKKQVRAAADVNDLIFLLGGMYFYPYDLAVKRFSEIDIDLSKSYTTQMNGRGVYVLGANSDTDTTAQVWIEKERLILLRHIRYQKGDKLDAVFEHHKQFGKGWVETLVTFYKNGKKRQVEHYHDIKTGKPVDEGKFALPNP
jgi:hypothetical protein